jgi:Rnl2 family RNA ligase
LLKQKFYQTTLPQKYKTMAEFQKYPSIENVKAGHVARFLETAPTPDEEWIVVPKQHGSNLSFSKTRGDNKLYVSSRNRLLGDVETYDHNAVGFFNVGYWFKEWAPQMHALADDLLGQDESVKQVTIFGELCGGCYDSKDVPKHPEGRVIQNGQLQYCPQNLFYGFDIKLSFIDGTRSSKWLDFDTEQFLFNKHNIFCEKEEFRGTLVDCLNFSAKNKLLPTEIPRRLGLPERPENIKEGNGKFCCCLFCHY